MPKEANSGNSVPLYLFHQGTNSKAYEYMGLRKSTEKDRPGMTCRVWAPNAKAVSLVGDFNGWTRSSIPLSASAKAACGKPISPLNWSSIRFINSASRSRTARRCSRSDPYAFHFETRPHNSSLYCDIEGFEWNDAAWYRRKAANPHYTQPVNIYEVHAGSWRRYADGKRLFV